MCDRAFLAIDNCIVLMTILVFRLASVFAIHPWYVNGEYLHNLEVAHKWAFGYGYSTRGWSEGIYSAVHPLSITFLYNLLAWMGLDQVGYLVKVPHIFQALLSSLADYSFYRWSKNNKWSLLLILSSSFWFYTATRPLISIVETCLTTIALRYYPHQNEPTTFKFLWIISFLIMIRPTAAIMWFPLCIFYIRNHIRSVGHFIKAYVLIPLIVGVDVVTLDSYAYGRLTVTLLDSFKYSIDPNYKLLPWYFYFTSGLLVILGLVIFLFAIAAIETLRWHNTYQKRFNLLITILFTLGIHSCFPRKDFRIILPLQPLCLYITGDALKIWSRKLDERFTSIMVFFILIFNVMLIFYMNLLLPRGTDIMIPIEHIAREYRTPDGDRAEFLILTPCYSMPLYSHVHQNISMRFPTCEPNLSGVDNFIDENDQFYANSTAWFQSHVPVHLMSAIPTHVVLLDVLQPDIDDFLINFKLIHNVSLYHLSPCDKGFISPDIKDMPMFGYHILLFERIMDLSLSKTTEIPN